MIESFSMLPAFLSKNKIIGCFTDTTVLFSFSYPLDLFNDDSEAALRPLSGSNIPIFTNVNVRSEFLENHRKVLIAESLIDFLEEMTPDLDGGLIEKLKAHRTSYRRKVNEEKSAKIDINQIKKFRKLLTSRKSSIENGWEGFCRKYLNGKIETIWPMIQSELNIQFISLRSKDGSPYLHSIPEWKQVMSLMGRYGIASSDAMILNMLLCSKIPVLLTADLEMAEVADKESKGLKNIFVPDSIFAVMQ